MCANLDRRPAETITASSPHQNPRPPSTCAISLWYVAGILSKPGINTIHGRVTGNPKLPSGSASVRMADLRAETDTPRWAVSGQCPDDRPYARSTFLNATVLIGRRPSHLRSSLVFRVRDSIVLHQLAAWTKSRAGRSSHVTIRIASLIPIANRARFIPLSWLGLHCSSCASCGHVKLRSRRCESSAS